MRAMFTGMVCLPAALGEEDEEMWLKLEVLVIVFINSFFFFLFQYPVYYDGE